MDKLYKSLSPDQQQEDRTLRTVQTLVDSAGRRIVTGTLSRREAERLALEVREAVSRLLPDQMELYDRIYGARFQHWIKNFCSES